MCVREMFSDCLQGPYIHVGRTNQVLDQTSEEAKTGPRYAVLCGSQNEIVCLEIKLKIKPEKKKVTP